jgi:small subunit ribosomal protein S5
MQRVQEVWSFNMQARSNRRDNRPGRDKPEEKEFDEQVVNVDRVARVVKGGRRFRFRALVIVGDKKGRLGIGLAKGTDVTTAVTKAVDNAKKHVININLYKHTIPHAVDAKVSGAHIIIKPASAGTGLIAGGVVRTVLELAGVKNALSKSLGSSNKVNTAYATQEALLKLVPAKNWVTNMAANKPAIKNVDDSKETKPVKSAVKAKPVKKAAKKTAAKPAPKPKSPVKKAKK